MELPQETQIIIEEGSKIIDAVAKHRQSLDPHAKGVAGKFLGIDARIAEHIRMHHAATEDLQPFPFLPEDIYLGRRLGEGKVGCPEP